MTSSTPWLIVSTPIPAEVSTKQKPFELGCLDDTAHDPMTTATPKVEMDGEGGENATTDEITNTGVKIILD